LILVERRFPGRTKSRTINYPDLQLVRERRLFSGSRLEIFTRQKGDDTLLFPKTQADLVALAARFISGKSDLGREVSAGGQAKLTPATT